jgi:23S rRNA pseudouridine2605 synthase
LNKPKGFVTTTDDPQERKTVMNLIENACPERVYPVGRLDKDTTGLLLFTNDGDLVKKLTHPSHSRKKIYHVYLDKPLTKNNLLEIAKGVQLEDGFVAADAINYVDEEDKREIGIEIHSGQNRVVRRIFAHLGYEVQKLDRVYFAGLTKKNLPRGKWRFLIQSEINQLKMQ